MTPSQPRTNIRPVPGTPRWAVAAAYGTIACLCPSAVWRTALGLGADLGMPSAWRDRQQVPGRGTVHVIVLSASSLGAAGLTLSLVYPWGQSVPRWSPWLPCSNIPALPVVVSATTGATAVVAVSASAGANWHSIATAQGDPTPVGF